MFAYLVKTNRVPPFVVALTIGCDLHIRTLGRRCVNDDWSSVAGIISSKVFKVGRRLDTGVRPSGLIMAEAVQLFFNPLIFF